MKKFDYSEKYIPSESDRIGQLEEAKGDEREIPYYSKEVPESSSTKYEGKMAVVTYNWKNIYETTLKVQEIRYEDGNDLDGLYKVNVRDGADRTAFNYKGKTYIIRKVVKTVAKEIYENAKKVADVVENIIGWLKTVAGNFYIITKLDKEAWVFDKELQAEGIKVLDKDKLSDENKRVLFEQVLEKTADLHLKDYVLGKFSMDSIMLYDNAVLFTDLRMLNETRKLSFLVKEFKRILSVLQSNGFASEEEFAYGVRYYVTENPNACKEWFKEEMKKNPSDDEEIAEKLEEKLYSYVSG